MNKNMSLDDLLTNCEISSRYHHARAAFYRKIYLPTQFMIFLLSSAGIVNLIYLIAGNQTINNWIVGGATVTITALSLFNLLYNPGDKKGRHTYLYEGFIKLTGAIQASQEINETIVSDWKREFYALIAKEPDVYNALYAHCYNQVSRSLDAVNKGYYVDMKWYHYLLFNIWRFSAEDFPIRNQVQEEQAQQIQAQAHKPA